MPKKRALSFSGLARRKALSAIRFQGRDGAADASGQPDASGRQSPEEIEGAIAEEPADLVIKALGFEPEDLPGLWNQDDLEVTSWGTIRAEYTTGRTAMDGVFAVGDIVRGASWWSGPSATGATRRTRFWTI